MKQEGNNRKDYNEIPPTTPDMNKRSSEADADPCSSGCAWKMGNSFHFSSGRSFKA